MVRANEWAARLGLNGTVAFMYCNATISLAHMLSNYAGGLTTCTIQFPDPHFKKRHRKRRIFQPQV